MIRWLFIAVTTAFWVSAVVSHPQAAPQGRPAIAGHEGVAFATSDNCLACHNGLIASNGEDVSIGVSWRASMMANSSRDPYWQASVRRETIDHKSHGDAIQDECAICHMPMARASAHGAGARGQVFALAPGGREDSDAHKLAADGVSCTLCHQIAPDKLGTRESFVGGFTLSARTADGLRIYGPYEVEKGLMKTMRSVTDFSPAKADHLRQSELCATCHTLYTEAFGPNGEVVGSLPEQMPYLEWKHSAFAREAAPVSPKLRSSEGGPRRSAEGAEAGRSCQSCHMPDVESAPIASVLGEPRERLARHTFLGGNFFMLRMLNRFRAALGVIAPGPELEAAARATLRQLESDTATIEIARADVADGRLGADLVIRNLTGHKLPTGYPSRRVWVHLTVRDAAGALVFESGAVDAAGRINGNDNDTDPKRFEAHYDEIRSADQVQIYESIIAGRDGAVTTGLLTATQFVKDNRLLPRGFDKASAEADIAVHGDAARDANFTDAGDRVRYSVPVKGTGTFTVDAELRYQPIAFRWADNLRGYDAPEPKRFVSYYDAMSASSSTVLARSVRTSP
jgi:cytochrome c551/c552